MDPDRHVRELAERQHGIITSAQLRDCGLTPKQVHHRKRSGQLVKVLPEVFRLGGVPETLDGRLTAVACWMGDEGIFIGPTAAYLWELDGIDPPGRIYVARVTHVRSPSWLKVIRLQACDVQNSRGVRGLRVCGVEQALAGCAATLPGRRVGRALDDALRKRLTTLDRMWDFLTTWKGRPGAVILRTLLNGRDDRDEKVRTVFEAKMLTILKRIRRHHFLADHPVDVGGKRYFLDFYLPSAGLAIECHSFRWHMGKHNSDARRDRRIRSLGIEVLYFTWDDVCFHGRDVELEIREAIARRIAHFGT